MNSEQIREKIRKANSEQGKKNRISGEIFEMKLLKKQRKGSLMACRTAGSRSVIDVISIKNGKLYLTSAKTNGYFHPDELALLEKLKALKTVSVIVQKAYYVSQKKMKVFRA